MFFYYFTNLFVGRVVISQSIISLAISDTNGVIYFITTTVKRLTNWKLTILRRFL